MIEIAGGLVIGYFALCLLGVAIGAVGVVIGSIRKLIGL